MSVIALANQNIEVVFIGQEHVSSINKTITYLMPVKDYDMASLTYDMNSYEKFKTLKYKNDDFKSQVNGYQKGDTKPDSVFCQKLKNYKFGDKVVIRINEYIGISNE